MAFRIFTGIIFSFFIVMTTWADELELNPDHPQEYIVVKGDTLWGISARFLKNPWQWPRIWKGNKQIHNPNLIFPGDLLRLYYVDGRPQISAHSPNHVRLSPQIRSRPASEAIQTIPLDKIKPYLIWPLLVSQGELANAPYIVSFADEHLIGGAGTRIYVRSITKEGGVSSFLVVRPGETFVDPETGEVLAYEALFVANTRLQRYGDPATLLLTRTTMEVLIGDRLIPLIEEDIPLSFLPQLPETRISGRIIDVEGNLSQFGLHDVVVIDRGSEDGVKEGQVLIIYQAGEVVRDEITRRVGANVKLPDEQAGLLMVFRTFERVSYAIIMRAEEAMHTLDIVISP